MALTSSINNAEFSQSNTISQSGQFRGKVIPSLVRKSANGKSPLKVIGASLHVGGVNSAVSVAIGIEQGVSDFFTVAQGSIVETGIKPVSYTFFDAPSSFNIELYANGVVNIGTGNYQGINIELGTVVNSVWTPYQTFSNKTFVGRYEYIQVPAAPQAPVISQVTSSSLKITVSAPQDLGGGILSGYQVQLATSETFASGLRIYNLNDSETSLDIDGLVPGTTYYVRVLVKNELWDEAQKAGSPWSPISTTLTSLESSASSSGGNKEAFFRYLEPNVSNLYSEKVFAEHPLSLWALDDRADYIPLISEQERNMATWDIDGGAAIANTLSGTKRNLFINPSFETSNGTQEIRRNLITNPSFESVLGSQEVWRNIYPNPTFSEGSLGTTYSPVRINGFSNPNFESNADFWFGSVTVARQTSVVWSGTASGQIPFTSLNQYIEGEYFYTFGGEQTTISFYLRIDNGKQVQIGIQTYSESYSEQDFLGAQTISGNGSWQRVSISVKVYASGGRYYTPRIINKTSGTNTVYIDGALQERGLELLPYFDGSGFGPGYSDPDLYASWDGTPNASTSRLSGRDVRYTQNKNPGGMDGGAYGVGYLSSQWGLLTPGGDNSKSLKIVPRNFLNPKSSDTYIKINLPLLQANKTYTILGTIRLTQAQTNPSEFARKFRALDFVNNEEVDIALTYISEAPNAAGEYEVRATFETTESNVTSEFRLYNGDDTASVWWDNVAVVEGVYLGDYFDGTNSPEADLLPSWFTESGIRISRISGLVPAGQSLTVENGIAVVSSEWEKTGSRSLRVISKSSYQPSRCYTTLGNLGLEVGKTYTALITTRLESPQTGPLYSFPSIPEAFPYFVFNNVSGEQEGRITFTIDGVDVTLDDEISLYNRGLVGAGDVWFDNFMVIEGDYSGTYFDGGTVSPDPDVIFDWVGDQNLSQSVMLATKVLGIDNGYQSSAWSMLGGTSLRIPEGDVEVITLTEESTFIITGRNIGQELIVDGNTFTTTHANQEIELYGVLSVTIKSGWWDKLCIVSGTHTFGYFDGDNDIPNYYSTSWTNPALPNSSTSDATPIVSEILSIGVSDPFQSSQSFIVQPETGSQSVVCISQPFATSLDINDFLSSISIGLFIASDNENLASIDIGYTVDGTSIFSQNFAVSGAQQWLYVSNQFSSVIPDNGQGYRVFLRFNLLTTDTETNILINGLSVGQWAEEFQATSLGATRVEIPAEIGLPDFYGVAAEAYGLQDSNGYYVINDNRLLARNVNMPMVYGANNITSIYPHPDGEPSLILPGKGFLNDQGRYRDYTVEFWCRVNADATGPRRIFGPIYSDDGLYVDGPFLTLKVGGYIGSHYIGEWYRPMLIDLVYGKNVIRMMVDGEVVVSIPIVATSIALPEKTSDGIDQDWLGFYAYDDVDQVEIDSFSIFSYQVPQLVSKRRFVYGQGVEFPETLNTSFSGKSILLDHTFADYTNSYRYPDLGKWVQGISENVSLVNNVLSTPVYSLPRIVFNKQTTQTWYDDLSEVSDQLIDTITMKPNSSWDDTDGYILFDSLNIVKQDIKAFYGIFHVDGSPINDEVLFKVEDDATKNYLLITVSGDLFNGYDITYNIRYGPNAQPVELVTDHVVTINETLFVGIDIDKFARKYGKNLSSFFGNPRRLKVYAAGTKDFVNTFSGEISKIGFCTRRNFAKIASLFGPTGIFVPAVYDAGYEYFGNDPDVWDEIVDGGAPSTIFFESQLKNHIASYTLFASKYYGKFMLDIATDSYWEDYIPLTYFGKEVVSYDGDKRYGLDFLQFNIDYPRPVKIVDGNYDTSDSLVKTYISFQYIVSGANQPATSFNEIIPAPANNVIDPNAMLPSGASWINKKFEVVNNTIIYPPEGVDFKKLAIVMHVEFETNGILKKSVKIKNLQLSSKALDANRSNKIGTRLGQSLYPYTRRGLYFDYAAKNPYVLYRGSTPYLYLTKDSGIKLAGNIPNNFNRGLSTTINRDQASRFRLTAIQTAMMFPNQKFPTVPTPLFEVDTKKTTLQFFIISSHPNNLRGTIFCIDKNTGKEFSETIFFLNGRFVKNAEISTNEWNMFAVAFINNLDLDGIVGAIRVNGPMLINNMTFYEETALQQARQASLQQWFGILFNRDQDGVYDKVPWAFWDNETWEEVLIYSPNEYDGVNPVELYSTYAGTNKIIVGDSTTLTVGNYEYTIFKDIVSTPYTVTPL